MSEGIRRVKPFASFSRTNMWLVAAGFSRLLNPRNRWTRVCHKVYRQFVLLLVYVYALQHTIYAVQVREDTEKLVEGVILTVPELLLCVKATVLYIGTKRIDKLVELMDDPIFAANSESDEKYLKKIKKAMHRLFNGVVGSLPLIAVFWTLGPVFKRMQDPTSSVPTYVPFKTDTWPKFLIANFMDTLGVILWIGFGHLSIDCVVATYYAQAWVQLQIINSNLVHLFDESKTEVRESSRFEYLDALDKDVQKRFVYYIKRYERVHWFIEETTSIFNPIISFQFFTTSFSSCLAIFQMSSVDTFSATFAFSFGYYMVTQCQIFLYCYYGGLIEHESKFMADALYLGNWQSVSPKFRQQLLVAMTRWIKPITPKVSGIVPLSLTTYVSITRSAYTLFTVLKSRNNRGNGETTLAF